MEHPNPCKIIIIDRVEILKKAADLFGISVDKVTLNHLKTAKRISNISMNQWELAKRRVQSYEEK